MEEFTIDGFCVEWACLACGGLNVDCFNWTSCPICADCFEAYDWADILPQEEIDKLLSELRGDAPAGEYV